MDKMVMFGEYSQKQKQYSLLVKAEQQNISKN